MKKILNLLIVSYGIFMPFKSSYAGLYFGANVGANSVNLSKKVSYAQSSNTISDTFSSLRGQALVGYNFPILMNPESNQSIMLALEIDGAYNSGNSSSKINNWFLTTRASINEQLKYSFEAFIIPKFRFGSNMVLFVGPGFSQGKLDINTPSSTAGNLGITGNASTWLNGWAAKAGVEFPMSTNMNFVLTYQYTSYDSVTWTRTEPLTGESVTAQYKPYMNTLTVGVNWSIC